eukprot:g1250.t1
MLLPHEKKIRGGKMLGHRKPWSAVQSVTHAANMTVNDTCAYFVPDDSADPDCRNKCFDFFQAKYGLGSTDPAEMDDDPPMNFTKFEVTNMCTNTIEPLQNWLAACPNTPQVNTTFGGYVNAAVDAMCDLVLSNNFTVRNWVCNRAASVNNNSTSCESACLDFGLTWFGLSPDADLFNHVEDFQVFDDVTTADYNGDAYLTKLSEVHSAEVMCGDAAVYALKEYRTYCPVPAPEVPSNDTEKGEIVTDLTPEHHNVTCAARPGAVAYLEKKSGWTKMPGHRRPWSAVQQSVTHATDTAETVNEACETFSVSTTGESVAACKDACLAFFGAAHGLAHDDIIPSEHATAADFMDSVDFTESKVTDVCTHKIQPLQNFFDACPNMPQVNTTFYGGEDEVRAGVYFALCDTVLSDNFTVGNMICNKQASVNNDSTSCESACLDFGLTWLGLSPNASLFDHWEKLKVFDNVTTQDYASSAYLTKLSEVHPVEQMCRESAVYALEQYAKYCPVPAPEIVGEDADHEGKGEIVKDLTPEHHSETCAARGAGTYLL